MFSSAFIVRGKKAFYRSWGVEARGKFIKNITSVRQSEDCLHYCYITDKCQSINTFEVKEGNTTCQLFSTDICELDPRNGMSRNPVASVFFSKKIEECLWFEIHSDTNECVSKPSNSLSWTKDLSICAPFILKGGKMMSGGKCHWRNSHCYKVDDGLANDLWRNRLQAGSIVHATFEDPTFFSKSEPEKGYTNKFFKISSVDFEIL